MEITLEKIELVKDRTGVSYREAKEALEEANGSVVDAIINIEESMDYINAHEEDEEGKEGILKRQLKKTIAKGNMSRIIVRKGDTILLNLPLTAGLLGAVVAPWGVIFGVISAAGFNCKMEFVNDQGQITDINGKVKSQYRKARAQGQIYYDKGMEKVDKIKDSEFYEDLKEKGADMYNELRDRGQDVLEDFREKTAEGIDSDRVREGFEELKRKGSDIFRKKTEDEDDDFFEEFDLDVDDDEPVVVDADDATEEAAPVEEAAPAEAEAPIGEETKEDLTKILEEVAQESGIHPEN